MIPSLARLNLHSCTSCERDTSPGASVGVPFLEWQEKSEISCLICDEPLDNDSTQYPWTYDGGPRVVELCAWKHVYHIGCAVKAHVIKLNERVKPVCPECRQPYTQEVSQRIENSLLSATENPYEPTAVEYWDWENYKIAEVKARVASLITSGYFAANPEGDEMAIAGYIVRAKPYPSKALADFLSDELTYNPTGVANFANSLVTYILDNDIATMKEQFECSGEGCIDEPMADAARTMISSVTAMVSTMISSSYRLGMMMESNRLLVFSRADAAHQHFVVELTDLGKLVLKNPDELEWEEAMERYLGILSSAVNPYEPTAVKYWDWENYKIAYVKARVASLITSEEFKEQAADEEEEIAVYITIAEPYPSEKLANFLRADQFLYNPTQFVNFAFGLFYYILDNHLHTIKEKLDVLSYMTVAIDETLEAAVRTLMSSATDMVNTMISNSDRLQMMVQSDQHGTQLTELGNLVLQDVKQESDELDWEEAMERYNRILEERSTGSDRPTRRQRTAAAVRVPSLVLSEDGTPLPFR